jgi:SNF2 family DNA or RNA helicase
VVVDEAHRLKNEKAKLYTACSGITTQKRFGLTGTIMQNKIMELFNLFDWVVPGCLGDREHFRAYYGEPLKQGQRLSAPERFVQVADARKKHLVSVLRKFLLRRTKEETIGHLMLGKEDNIVFCKMSDVQKRVYRRMLQQPDIQILINKDVRCSCGSPLPQVECCKRTEPDGVIWSYLHRDNPDGCSICPFCLVLPCLVKLQQVFPIICYLE